MPIHPNADLQDLFEHNKALYEEDLSTYERGSIRLISLAPGEFHDSISCRLRTHRMDENLIYEALSYAWGTSSTWRNIMINGKEDFVVSESLFGVLPRIRQPDKAQHLWIDAICINQANKAEKSNQVNHMGEVYTRATLVYIWLGPCGGSQNLALEREDCTDHWITKDGDIEFNTEASRIPLLYCEDKSLNKKQWCVAKSFYHPQPTLPAQAEQDAAERISGHAGSLAEPGSWQLPKRSLLQLLKMTRDLAASDPRDRMYALFGVVVEWRPEPERIFPSYGQPYEWVCTDVTRYIIRIEGNLDILYSTWKQCAAAPSWALDFSSDHRNVLPFPFWEAYKTEKLFPFDTCRDNWRVPQFDKADKMLVEGIIFDTILLAVRSDGEYFPYSIPDISSTMEPAIPGILSVPNAELYYDMDGAKAWEIPGIAKLVVLWLQALGDEIRSHQTADLKTPINCADFEDQFARTIISTIRIDLLVNLKKGMDVVQLLDIQDDFESARSLLRKNDASFFDAARETLRDRTFFVTTGGFCSVGPANLCLDDIVVALYSASIPVVLRPAALHGEYTWVGGCYVSGIMKGELLNAYEAGKVDKTEFAIV